MKYELMQSINQIRDNLAGLDECNIMHPLLNGIYIEICKMEEIIDDDNNSDEDSIDRAYRDELD